jgi:hypothetical protein
MRLPPLGGRAADPVRRPSPHPGFPAFAQSSVDPVHPLYPQSPAQ